MASRLPLRWRLTLWYLALLALTLAVFAAGFYFGLRALLYDAVDTTVRDQAALVQDAIVVEGGEPRLAVPRVMAPDNDDRLVRISDAGGAVLLEIGRPGDTNPPNPSGVRRALRGERDLRWVQAGDDQLRVLAEPIVRDGVLVGVLEVGEESDADETLGLARTLSLAATPVILVFAATGGIWLAGRALAPIDRITRTAAAIGEHDLSRRIDLRLPDDEVGRLARTFNEMLDRVEDAFGRQRRFTADAAHELRTPLALMQGQLELALSQPRDAEADQQVLETLAGDVDRLARLAATLLALARGDSRGVELVRERVELGQLLELVAEQYLPTAEAAGVALRVDSAPVVLEADQDLLLQVLVNLLDNALRHAPRDSVVTLGCRREGERATILVADEGAGIAPEHLPHLFERFYRVEPERDQRRGGAGLGLSICKLLVEAHGGTIAVVSTPGQGTTVRVDLPA